MPTTVQDLATGPGLGQLAKALSASSPSEVERIRALVQRIVAQDPSKGNIKVQTAPGWNNASYHMGKNTITTGVANADIIGHELGHAQNTQHSPVYQKLLMAVQALASLNGKAAIPVMLGLHAFAGDATRKDAVNTLSGVSAALAGPILTEEASATANAVMNSDNKLQTLKTLLPAFGAHAIDKLLPVLLYQLDRRI